MPAAINSPLKSWMKRTLAVRSAIPSSQLNTAPADRSRAVTRQRCARSLAALLLVVGARLFDLIPGREHILALGPGHVLQPFERVLGISIGEADVVRERRLAVEVAHRNVAQQGFVLRAAQRVADRHAVGRT